MKIPDEFVGPILSAAFAVQAWHLQQTYKMNAKIAILFALAGNKEYTQRVPKIMKNSKFRIPPFVCLLSLLSVSLLVLALAGCVSKSPLAGQTNPATGQPFPTYVADTSGPSNTIAKLQAINSATASVDPYSPIVGSGLNLALGGITLVSGLVAWIKNKQAGAATAATATMAQGVVAAGAQAKVLDVASSTPEFATVATHINNATP